MPFPDHTHLFLIGQAYVHWPFLRNNLNLELFDSDRGPHAMPSL